MIYAYQTPPLTQDTSFDFVVLLGEMATSGVIANTGEGEFMIDLTKGEESTGPFTLPPQTKLAFPCNLSALTILPGDAPASVQLLAGRSA